MTLTRATSIVVNGLDLVSFGVPEVQGAALAVLTALPGLLWTLPRARPGPAAVPARLAPVAAVRPPAGPLRT